MNALNITIGRPVWSTARPAQFVPFRDARQALGSMALALAVLAACALLPMPGIVPHEVALAPVEAPPA
jgi:hypothetical protein